VDKKRILIAVIAGLVGILAVARLRGGETRTVREDWPANFAHRGASARAPENTLEAFRLGMEAGAGGLELDVHMSLDKEVVVIHDPTVDRTTDGSGAVARMTLEEIKALDAGYRFSPDGGSTYPYRGRGLSLPTLAEVYEEFPNTPANIEIKEAQPGVEEAVLGVIREAGAVGRTLVASNRHGVVRRFRRISGGRISTAASRREIARFYLLSRLRLERLLRPAYDALQVPPDYRGTRVVTRRFLEAAHARGVRVDVWTINDPDEMRRVLDLGSDGVMTDRPEELAGVLGEREGS
jgi:glycerophosphoryl diester phosphodiesterase